MGLRVDARDVLDADGRTRRGFRARVVGVFRRTGPNPWDDFEYEAEAGGEFEVLPGIEVQVEPVGAEFRLRREGRVYRAEWVPGPGEAGGGEAELRGRFLDRCVERFGSEAGQGAGAFIARKLGS